MKYEIEIDDEFVVKVVLESLKESLEALEFFKGTRLEDKDLKKDIKAAKRMIDYYGGNL